MFEHLCIRKCDPFKRWELPRRFLVHPMIFPPLDDAGMAVVVHEDVKSDTLNRIMKSMRSTIEV